MEARVVGTLHLALYLFTFMVVGWLVIRMNSGVSRRPGSVPARIVVILHVHHPLGAILERDSLICTTKRSASPVEGKDESHHCKSYLFDRGELLGTPVPKDGSGSSHVI